MRPLIRPPIARHLAPIPLGSPAWFEPRAATHQSSALHPRYFREWVGWSEEIPSGTRKGTKIPARRPAGTAGWREGGLLGKRRLGLNRMRDDDTSFAIYYNHRSFNQCVFEVRAPPTPRFFASPFTLGVVETPFAPLAFARRPARSVREAEGTKGSQPSATGIKRAGQWPSEPKPPACGCSTAGARGYTVAAGRIFALRWNTLPGSYLALSWLSRSYFSGP